MLTNRSLVVWNVPKLLLFLVMNVVLCFVIHAIVSIILVFVLVTLPTRLWSATPLPPPPSPSSHCVFVFASCLIEILFRFVSVVKFVKKNKWMGFVVHVYLFVVANALLNNIKVANSNVTVLSIDKYLSCLLSSVLLLLLSSVLCCCDGVRRICNVLFAIMLWMWNFVR